MLRMRLAAVAPLALGLFMTGNALAACGVAPLPLETSAVEAFKAAPDSILTRYLSGGSGMTREAYNLIITDPTTVDSFVTLVSKANALQKFALGTGLGDAVRQCSAKDPAVADALQTAIAALEQPEFEIAFTQAINQIETAAIGGAAGGGGPFGTSAAVEGLIGDDGVPNDGGNYFTGGGAGSPRSNRNSGTTATRVFVSP
jgi:hypothetical protein